MTNTTVQNPRYQIEFGHRDPHLAENVDAYVQGKPDPFPDPGPFDTYEHFKTSEEVSARVRAAMSESDIVFIQIYEYGTWRNTSYVRLSSRWVMTRQDKRGSVLTVYDNEDAMLKTFAEQYNGCKPEEVWNVERVAKCADGTVIVLMWEDLPFYEWVPGKYPTPAQPVQV